MASSSSREQGGRHTIMNQMQSVSIVSIQKSNMAMDKVMLTPPGEVHAVVIEHNVATPEMDSPLKSSPSRKRHHDEPEGNLQLAEAIPRKIAKRQDKDESKVLKSKLLTVMWKIINKHFMILEMSQINARKMALKGNEPCEHTLGRIEEKIKKGEISSIENLFIAFRGIVSFYIHLMKYRSIPRSFCKILEALRAETV